MKPRLKDAVQSAYEVFGWRSLSAPLEVCHCESCMSVEVAESILKTPLRELSNEQLSEYTNSAHDWSDQFLYLLPRYMELVTQGKRPTYLDPEHIFGRFRYVPENRMSSSETAAFNEWLSALFEETLCRPISSEELAHALARQHQPSWDGFGSDICEIVQLALPTPFDTLQLQVFWEACEVREASLRMASTLYFGIGAQRFYKDGLLPEYVSNASAQWHDWFTLKDHTKKLSQAYDRDTDPQAKELLLLAI